MKEEKIPLFKNLLKNKSNTSNIFNAWVEKTKKIGYIEPFETGYKQKKIINHLKMI